MGEEAGVAEDLKLLADFVFDVAVVGVKLFHFTGEGVGVGCGEFLFAEAAHGVEDVQCPATLLGFDFGQRFDAAKLGADVFRGSNLAIRDDGNAGIGGDAMERDVAADPTSTTGRYGERLAFDDGRSRESEAGHEQQVLHAPCGQFVLHEVEVGRRVLADRFEHRAIGTVVDLIADTRLLAFKLIPEAATRAGVIAGLGVVSQTA